MRKTGVVLAVILAVGLLVGCAKPPQVDIDAAKSAIQQARSMEASEYAPDALRAAEDAQAQLEAELKVQEEKFALFRSYKKATELSATAKAAGERAEAAAKDGKQKTMDEASAAISGAKTALAEATDLLSKAPKGKGTQADLAALEADLQTVASTLADADSAFASQRYKDAKAKAEAAMGTINNVKAAVEAAIAAKQGRR